MVYNIWYNVDYQCDIEGTLYDLSMFCFDHDCTPPKLIDNAMERIFQVTATMNALSAVYYEQLDPADHQAVFDFYALIGVNIGKLFRYVLMFDP